jgi:hypothetical protein
VVEGGAGWQGSPLRFTSTPLCFCFFVFLFVIPHIFIFSTCIRYEQCGFPQDQGQGTTIVSQKSEIDGLKSVKKKCQDKLERSAETNEAQQRELAQVKDQNKAMKAHKNWLLADVGKPKEEIRQMAVPRFTSEGIGRNKKPAK